MKVANVFVEICCDCPHCAGGYYCHKAHRPMTREETDYMDDEKLDFPSWCPLDDADD